MASELFLELYSEEIPARMQRLAAEKLEESIRSKLAENGLLEENSVSQIFYAPCRIAIAFSNVKNIVEAKQVEKKGPKVLANEQAIKGFVSSLGVEIKDLEVRNIDNVDYYYYVSTESEKKTLDILPSLLHDAISKLVWPKSMRWGNYDITWVRPLKNILCIFGEQVVDVTYGPIKANNKSFGHKFMTGASEINDIKSASDWQERLKLAKVVASPAERGEKVRKYLLEFCAKNNLQANIDEKLLAEVTGLVEFVNPLSGKIADKYMSVPAEVLISAIKTHQKYFTFTKQDGSLSEYFVVVANIESSDDKSIIAGNERVLSARLSDAKFFYDEDRKISLFDMREKLHKLRFHLKLGSVYQKTERLEKIVSYLAKTEKFSYLKGDGLNVAKLAASLCKSDLVSGLVDEFPELQGIIGSYYAAQDQRISDMLPSAGVRQLASGLKEQYETSNFNSEVGLIISLADKLDSLVGLYLAGERATGSKDPYALRRYALAILPEDMKEINSYEDSLSADFNMFDLIKYVVELYITAENALESNIDKDKVSLEIAQFIIERALAIPYNPISEECPDEYKYKRACFIAGKDMYLYQQARKYKALRKFGAQQVGQDVLAAYKRAKNILSKASISKILTVDSKIFETEAEKALFMDLSKAKEKLAKSLSDSKYSDSLKELAELKPSLDQFFDNVMVNAEDEKLRLNRLALLSEVVAGFESFADFSKIL